MANNAASQGKSEADVCPLYEQTIALYRQLKNRARLGPALTHLGVFYLSLKRYPVAKRLHEEAIELLRQTDSRRGLAYALNSYGSILRAVEETETALLSYQESLKLFREMGERQGTASVLGFLGTLQLNDSPQATIPLFRESLLLWRELNLSFKPGVLIALYALSYIFYQIGDPEQSASLFGAADNLYKKQCTELNATMIEESDFFTWRDEAQKNIPTETWTSRYEAGKRLDWSAAVTFAVQ